MGSFTGTQIKVLIGGWKGKQLGFMYDEIDVDNGVEDDDDDDYNDDEDDYIGLPSISPPHRVLRSLVTFRLRMCRNTGVKQQHLLFSV